MSVTFAIVAHDSPQYHQTVQLRHEVLRAPLRLQFPAAELAAESAQFHIAAYDNHKLVGCLVLVPQDASVLKMRQVAIAPQFQKRGIGHDLVQFAETFARANGFHLLTLHARETAVDFYLKLGYEVCSEPFCEVNLPHHSMQKSL